MDYNSIIKFFVLIASILIGIMVGVITFYTLGLFTEPLKRAIDNWLSGGEGKCLLSTVL